MSKANIANQGFHTNPERINRKGRPRKLPELDQLLIELLGGTGERSRMRQVLETIINEAVGGNLRAAEMLLNRAYGKPKENIDIISNQPIAPTIINFVDDDYDTIYTDGFAYDAFGNLKEISPKEE
jgi:hypothetical protein